MSSPLRDVGSDHLPPIDTKGRCSSSNKELKLEDFYSRSNSPLEPGQRKAILELQEQVKILREDTKKKDELIQKLSSMEISGSINNRLLDATLGAGIAAQSARGELAAMQVKLDNFSSKMREKETECETMRETITLLKRENESLKEDSARQSSQIESLSRQLEEYEHNEEAFHALKTRNETAVRTIQTEYQSSLDRIADLEARLKYSNECLDNSENLKNDLSKRFEDLHSQICKALGSARDDSLAAYLQQISHIKSENENLRGKVKSLEEGMSNTDVEQKASRETIMRLVSEVSRDEKELEARTIVINTLKAEIDKLKNELQELKGQLSSAHHRYETADMAQSESKKQYEDLESRLQRVMEESQKLSKNASIAVDHRQFMQDVSAVLCTIFPTCQATEHAILDSLKQLTREIQHKEENVRFMTAELQTAREMSTRVPSMVRDENRERELLDRIHHVEGELAAVEVLTDSLRRDKEKFLKYMQRLAEMMKMDRINADIGFDMIGESILSRAAQLTDLEANALADKQTAMYNLKRRLKQLKDQLESKDLHLDLLRKKISALEEQLHGKADVEKERDHETLQVRKLVKQLEKTQKQVEHLREENVNLKAQLLEFSHFKITALEQNKEMTQMRQTIQQLNQNHASSVKEVRELKGKLSTKDKILGETTNASDSAVQSLSSELKTTKQSLDEARRRERQLLDFRAVIGRMLGLDIDVLAIPDYEIINRLERLVQAHQSNVYTAFTMEQSLADMDKQLRADPHIFSLGYRTQTVPFAPSPDREASSYSNHGNQKSFSPLFQRTSMGSKLQSEHKNVIQATSYGYNLQHQHHASHPSQNDSSKSVSGLQTLDASSL